MCEQSKIPSGMSLGQMGGPEALRTAHRICSRKTIDSPNPNKTNNEPQLWNSRASGQQEPIKLEVLERVWPTELNGDQDFVVPVLDSSRASVARSAGWGHVGCGYQIAPWVNKLQLKLKQLYHSIESWPVTPVSIPNLEKTTKMQLGIQVKAPLPRRPENGLSCFGCEKKNGGLFSRFKSKNYSWN